MTGKLIKTTISFCVMALCAVMSLCAQGRGDGVVDIKIYFHYDESFIDSTYMDNEQNLFVADSLLRDSAYITTISKIIITAQSSPEGTVAYNARLSERRRLSLKEFFTTNYPQIDPSLWSFKAVAENWELFHQHLVASPNLPHRSEVLTISSGDRDPDAKEWLLRTMHNGEPWAYIKENILPSHRFGASVLFLPKLLVPIMGITNTETRTALPSFVEMESYTTPTAMQEAKVLVAVKTNLVLDALSVVNLGVEVPIGERWSVVGEVVHPWWRSWPANYTMQIESYHGELKYWLGDRTSKEQLQGWSVGAYGGWGRYDIQPFIVDGVQGEFTDFGLELGYSHPIARNFNIEYTIGLGYTSTSYQDYEMANDTDEYGDIKVIPYPWLQNKLRTIFPTRCGVSLVWLIKGTGRVRK